MIAAAKAGFDAVGLEAHPFIARIANVKLNWAVDLQAFAAAAQDVLADATQRKKAGPDSASPLLLKCYDADSLAALEALKAAYEGRVVGWYAEEVEALVWLAITCILRECSGVGTAQWQYILPNKTKARVKEPFEAFRARVGMFIDDLVHAGNFPAGDRQVLEMDARDARLAERFDLVVSSPPYPNNYDYADATRLEMTFWKDISGWGDLQGAVRRHLVRCCSQHSAAERLVLEELLADPAVLPIADELRAVCEELDVVRQGKGGRKTYHTMVAAYFVDLAKVWISLRKLVKEEGQVIFMVGDSAPYGVHVPCEEWLGCLAVSAGFRGFGFEKVRDRNIKWKNRKHTVPLKEGILRVEG